MPLHLFRSRAFSGINLMTLLLYGALGGAFFLLPFDLIQVHGYSATLAGAVFLPFTVIMGLLSRWSGGLLDRIGARLPLVVGPTITGVGFTLIALAGPTTSYWIGFLLPTAIVGLGMAITVAALDQHLATPSLSSSARKAIESARGRFVIDSSLTTALGADRLTVEAIVKTSLAEGIRIAMLLAAALALVSAACAEFTLRPGEGRRIAGQPNP